MTGKLTVQVESFKPMRSNTLVMPGKAQITRDGAVRRDDRGKTLYTPTLEFTDKSTRDAFSARVIAALLEFAPTAFDAEGTA
jgi:hypothetical protein